ncbi:choice-of-anchor I domain-containing protein [[Ruminococcus] torques]|uniref:choice-of-anchor I domain-containing protein n=1 Tax=[Ruminococcus] torques TaxID=33039 RepID=UPI0037DC7018
MYYHYEFKNVDSKATQDLSAYYEDYEKYPIDIDKKDAAYRPVSYPSLRGIRMPDGISLFESNGKTYIVTANEGDSREWNEYLNEAECNFGKGQTSPSGKITAENSGLTGKVVFFDQNDYEGLNSEYDYLFGGRSFTVYCVDGSGMKEVYTSGNELEAKTAAYFPQYFNCSNDSAEIDDRSGKKGVEAESVTIGTVGEKTYAFIGLERIGGVMAYDITNPDKILFANYINSRDFSKDIAGDVSPEGLCMISASESADGNAYLLASCEVSGTVAAYKLISQNIDSSDDDNTDNNHDNNIDHNGSGHGGADTEDLNNQESKTNALKTGDHAPVIGTGIGMVLALSAIIVILKYRRSKNTITNTK